MSKYTPAVFQPTIRPQWGGILSYISEKEKSDILEAIIKFPAQTEINSTFWEETIKPDLEVQYETFVKSSEAKGKGAKAYWQSRGKDMDKISLPYANHDNNICITYGKDIKDKDKDKDNNKNNINNNNNKNINNKYNLVDYSSDSLREAAELWLTYKKEKGQTYKSIGLKQMYEKLHELSEDDPQKAIEIVKNAIANNWSGFYPIREEKQRKPNESVYSASEAAPDAGRHHSKEELEKFLGRKLSIAV